MIVFSLFVLMLPIIHSFGTPTEFMGNIAFNAKILLFLLWITLVRNYQLTLHHNNEIFIYLFLFFNVVLSFAGIGYLNYGVSQYGIPLGIKGIFQSGNEYSIAVVTLLIGFAWLRPSVQGIFACILCLLPIGTKVALIGTFLVSILNLRSIGLKKIWFLLTFLSLILFWNIERLSQFLGSIFERIIDNYNMADNILSFFLSSRDSATVSKFLSFAEYDVISILFGVGLTEWEFSKNLPPFIAEIDIVDISGINGLFFSLGLYIYFLYVVFTVKDSSYRLMFSLLFILSFISGHVVYNTIVVVFALAYSKDTKRV
jgi:hypothetical protein